VEEQKEKLKLLGEQFDQERNEKTKQLRPIVLGCVWVEDDMDLEHAAGEFSLIIMQPYLITTVRRCPTYRATVLLLLSLSHTLIPRKKYWILDCTCSELLPHINECEGKGKREREKIHV